MPRDLPGEPKSQDVHEEFRETNQLQGGADEGRGDDVVDEEGTVVWQKDTLPAEGLVLGPQHNLRKTLGTKDGRKPNKHTLSHTNPQTRTVPFQSQA